MFRYDQYHPALTDTIAARIANQGAIEAQRAQNVGNAYAGMVQNIGGAVAQIPGQMAVAKRAGLQDQLLSGQVADAQQARQGNATVDSMMRGDQLPTGDAGPRQQSYLGADGLFDIGKMTQALGASGMGHLAPDLLKGAESINDSILKHQQTEQQLAKDHAILIGDLADGALKLHQGVGMPLDGAMDFVVQPALATKRISPEDYAKVKAQIAALPPDQQVAALGQLMNQAAQLAPNKTLSKDAQEVDRYGRVTASNVVAEPNKGDYTGPDGVRYHANGTPVTGAVMKPQGAPKSIESKPVLLDGKPSLVNYDPATGKYATPDGADVSARVRPIPAASITINNEKNKALDLPVWATDASRPTGAEANQLDKTIRMTPNGLHQAALNYIANGQFPPTGRGTDPIAVAQRAAITSKVGAIAADSGMDEPALRAFYKSNSASLAQQQKSLDSVQGFMATADRNADLLKQTLAKIPDIGSPLLNVPVRAISQKALGSVDLSQFKTYVQSVQNEYARIISQPNLSGQLTDSARKEAEQLIDPNATVSQIVGSIDALRNEGSNRLLSIGEQIQRIQKRMTVSPTVPTVPAGGMIEAVDQQGKIHHAPAGTPLPAGWKLK